MKRIYLLLRIIFAAGAVLGLLGSRMLSAQTPLTGGKHTQSGNEIVYIQEGSVILEVQGKPPATVKAGEAFKTVAGEVHNVKNASTSEHAKALAFYIAKTGARLEDLAVPAK